MENRKYFDGNNMNIPNINKIKDSLSHTNDTTLRHSKTRKVENVLILQGGGSLGAFGCGVIKGLVKKGISFDIVC
jgi:hypothetical protein